MCMYLGSVGVFWVGGWDWKGKVDVFYASGGIFLWIIVYETFWFLIQVELNVHVLQIAIFAFGFGNIFGFLNFNVLPLFFYIVFAKEGLHWSVWKYQHIDNKMLTNLRWFNQKKTSIFTNKNNFYQTISIESPKTNLYNFLHKENNTTLYFKKLYTSPYHTPYNPQHLLPGQRLAELLHHLPLPRHHLPMQLPPRHGLRLPTRGRTHLLHLQRVHLRPVPRKVQRVQLVASPRLRPNFPDSFF